MMTQLSVLSNMYEIDFQPVKEKQIKSYLKKPKNITYHPMPFPNPFPSAWNGKKQIATIPYNTNLIIFATFFNIKKWQKWDAELAAMAQGWSDQCFFEHGNPENTSPFGYVGQNLYIRYYSKGGQPAPSAAVPIQKWYDEASQYTYADRSCSGVCGHYTQVCVCQCFYIIAQRYTRFKPED